MKRKMKTILSCIIEMLKPYHKKKDLTKEQAQDWEDWQHYESERYNNVFLRSIRKHFLA